MSTIKRFEDLTVWQEARRLTNALYDATVSVRDFAYRDQIRRAAISVMNNIAEGFERHSDADFAHFLTMAKGSSGEIRSLLHLGEDRRYFSPDLAIKLRDSSKTISGGISNLAFYLRKPAHRPYPVSTPTLPASSPRPKDLPTLRPKDLPT